MHKLGVSVLSDYDRLKEAIQNSGKKKKYLCEKMGKPPYYLRDVIKQKNKIPEDLQKILAEELFVTVEWLNGADDSIYPHGYRALTKANEEIAKLKNELTADEKKPVPTDGDGPKQEWVKLWAAASPEGREAALAVLRVSAQAAERQAEQSS